MIFRNIAANTRQLKYWSLPSVVGLHYVPPHRRLQSITASPSKFFSSYAKSHLVDEKRAIAGTKKWIQDWVIDQNMCPFAAKSSYEVVAHCDDTLNVDCVSATLECAVYNFYKKARKDLEDQRYKNLFITLPNVFSSENSLEEFEELTSFLIANKEFLGRELFCSPYELIHCDSYGVFVVQSFHPENYATRTHNYSMRSPWPTWHLMFSDDLKKAWGPNDKVSRRIIEDNGRMLARFSDAELDEKLESYRNVEVEKLVDEKRAIAGTKKWIQDWVIDQNMCPFAAKSSYEVVAHCGDTFDGVPDTITNAVENILHSKAHDLDQRYKNLFITLPIFSSLEEFEELTSFLIDNNPELFCSPYELLIGESDAVFVVQSFHPENYATRMHKYSMRSPWPTLHLIFSDDLKKAWGPNDKVSRRIIEDNGRMLARFSDAELDEKLESYRNVEVEKKE